MRLNALGPALVGGFVLGGFGFVVLGILFFGGGALATRSSRAVVFFEGSVGGLSAGAPVTFRGLQVARWRASRSSSTCATWRRAFLSISSWIRIACGWPANRPGGRSCRRCVS